MLLLRAVSDASEVNRMTSANLAVVLGPNILFNSESNGSGNPSSAVASPAPGPAVMSAAALASAASSSKEEYTLVHSVVKTMIENNDQLFQVRNKMNT